MSKNVCILSMQRVPNFGSLLQSYSLRKMLIGIGCNVSFIDIKRIDDDDRLRGNVHHDFNSECSNERGFFQKIKKIDKYTINRLLVKQKQKKQDILLERFCINELNIKDSDNEKHYDYCVIGSDEVFNCMTESRWGFTSQLFGNVSQADKVITYAASCGATEVNQLPVKVKEKIQVSFQNISRFSVRDENTYKFVALITNQEPLLHLDPVVVGNLDEEIAKATLPEKLSDKYCVIYSYYNRIKSNEEIKAIKHFCKTHDLKIISVGAPQFWIKEHVIGTPFQILKTFANAEFVITDTFHGTIFSAKYTKRFAVLLRGSNKNKLGDLIDRLGLQKHLLENINKLEQVYSVEKDMCRINKIVANEEARTLTYLRNSIY